MNWKQGLLLAFGWTIISLLISTAFTLLMGTTFQQGLQQTLILYGILALCIGFLVLFIETWDKLSP